MDVDITTECEKIHAFAWEKGFLIYFIYFSVLTYWQNGVSNLLTQLRTSQVTSNIVQVMSAWNKHPAIIWIGENDHNHEFTSTKATKWSLVTGLTKVVRIQKSKDFWQSILHVPFHWNYKITKKKTLSFISMLSHTHKSHKTSILIKKSISVQQFSPIHTQEICRLNSTIHSWYFFSGRSCSKLYQAKPR